MFGWAGTLDARPNDARAFYATIAVATLPGAALTFVGLDPVRALYWAAVVNGVLAAPLMAVMMLIVRNPRVMGRLTLSRSMASGAGRQRPSWPRHLLRFSFCHGVRATNARC